ncbi:MAG: hypothetical protein HY553_13910 [Elusimicrobia bacterium]|nr:hypothetical protein [Elusimicrobiota bacterium]
MFHLLATGLASAEDLAPAGAEQVDLASVFASVLTQEQRAGLAPGVGPEAAIAAMRTEQREAAREKLRSLEATTRDAAGLRVIGQGYFMLAQFDDAMRAARKVQASDPGFPGGYSLEATAAYHSGDFDLAVARAQESLRRDPEDPVALAVLRLSERRVPRLELPAASRGTGGAGDGESQLAVQLRQRFRSADAPVRPWIVPLGGPQDDAADFGLAAAGGACGALAAVLLAAALRRRPTVTLVASLGAIGALATPVAYRHAAARRLVSAHPTDDPSLVVHRAGTAAGGLGRPAHCEEIERAAVSRCGFDRTCGVRVLRALGYDLHVCGEAPQAQTARVSADRGSSVFQSRGPHDENWASRLAKQQAQAAGGGDPCDFLKKMRRDAEREPDRKKRNDTLMAIKLAEKILGCRHHGERY